MRYIEKTLVNAPDASELAVVVHGLSRLVLKFVPDEVRKLLPGADILIPLYDSSYSSNINPIHLANELSDLIQTQCDEHQRSSAREYQRITLIGHSRGGLLLRKAYVIACGQAHELWTSGLRPEPKRWGELVARIVLMAAINRGVSLESKPPAMSWTKFMALRTSDLAARLTGQARLLRGMKRGAPFIANLRVQWLNVARVHPMPTTVQILGDRDDIVRPEDNIDLQSGQKFVYLNAPTGTTHATVVDLQDQRRRDVFRRALMTPDNELKSEYRIPPEQQPNDRISKVIFVMHGIRDYGDWTKNLANVLRKEAAARGIEIATITSSYGYFPMLRFLLFSERRKNVRWFMDQYTEARARYPNAAIDFIGHSNGTYLLASALRSYRACEFHRAVFARSVVPRNFPWDEMVNTGRIEAIRNYVASSDLVVGIFPRIFEKFGDVGAAGLLGFTTEPAREFEMHFVGGGHGAAISEDNFPSICSFILAGKRLDPPENIVRKKQPTWVLTLSNLCWIVWIAMLGVIAIAGWGLAIWSPSFAPNLWIRLATFAAFLLAVLATV